MALCQKRLTDLLEEKGLQKKQVADILHVSGSAVTKYFKGKNPPPVETLFKLADFFGVTVDYLLGRSDLKDPYAMSPLSEEEAAVMQLYRSLDLHNRIRTVERMRALLDTQE